jgi:hypothetical protein
MSAQEDQKEQYEREVAFANMGKQVLNNDAYKQALAVRKAQIFDIFCKTKKDQGDVREEAWMTMKNLDALESYFQQLLETGKMAEMSLEQAKQAEDNTNH